MGGICGTDPVATRSRPKPIVRPSTSTAPGAAMRARPRTSSTSRSASHSLLARVVHAARDLVAVPERAGRHRSSPVTASAAPGTSRAAASASGGRSSAFDGMQA